MDPFERANYRSLIAWGPRIRREEPFLARALADLPDRSVADLGCGTGEHSRHLSGKGFRVAGLDASESMIADATSEPVPPNLRFVLGDLREADRVLGERFGAAILLGNILPAFLDEADLDRALGAAARVLLPGGRLLFQILNYERLAARKVRHLPLNFDDGPDGTTIFLRLLEHRDGGRVLFFPTTIRLRPEETEAPVEVIRTRRVELRGWTLPEALPALARSGFVEVETFGGMEGQAYEPLESPDLVVWARRGSGA